MKKIAVIGSGISGISAAHYLNKLNYDVSIYESNNYFGGHTNTQELEIDGVKYFPVNEDVYARDYQEARQVALARNPNARVVGVNAIVESFNSPEYQNEN